MSSQHRQTGRAIDTDEEIPALQSASDSSESEGEPIPPRPPRQPTVPPRRPLATGVFDSDDSDMDITESGNVIFPFDSPSQ